MFPIGYSSRRPHEQADDTGRCIDADSGLGRGPAPCSQPALPTTQASEPVRVNGVEFQLVAATLWPVPTDSNPTTLPLALKLTNHTGKAMQVNVFDTITVHLKDAPARNCPSAADEMPPSPSAPAGQ